MDKLENSTHSEELLTRYQSGDGHALERLWTRFLPRLRRWAHGRLRSPGRNDLTTDDLIQDAFVRSLARLRTLQPQGRHSLFGFFKTVVLNLIRDYARQCARRPTPELLKSGAYVDEQPTPLERVLGQEVIDCYQRALETLTEDEQNIIFAAVELRCSDREIAELFEKPSADAARMARGRAIGRLARAMEADERAASLLKSARQ
jgi:RNA polymerase sigma factor (sigma-70 family)